MYITVLERKKPQLCFFFNKAYRPYAHLLDTIMNYNINIKNITLLL